MRNLLSALPRLLLLLALIAMLPLQAAEEGALGTVKGTVIDRASTTPLQYVTISVLSPEGGKVQQADVTDASGSFNLTGLPAGNYRLQYGMVGAEKSESTTFAISTDRRLIDLGRLSLATDPVVKLQSVEVSARTEAFYNSIDRKVYHVGKEVQSVTGSTSDLLKNIPSVQVDIEGNVSLRGDGNVLILIDGKTSAMMGRNRAAALEQMSADNIEKIEVITNPSAKYKPDGTAGIINLTLKKKREPGYSGSARVSVGNGGRYDGSVTANFNPGNYTLFGSAGVRQDDRPRTVQDDRTHLDPGTNSVVTTSQRTTEKMRPLSRLAQFGTDYKLSDQTKIGGHLKYNYRDFVRESTVTSRSTNSASGLATDYDRQRRDPEYQEDLEFTGTLHHAFQKEDRELSLELRRSRTTEQEDNHYANIYRAPVRTTSFDHTLIKAAETVTEVTADYAHPIDKNSKLETGYSGQANTVDMDFRGSFLDAATNTWTVDATRTNRFIYDATIHAMYATYARSIEPFGALAGLRFEQAQIDTEQVTARRVDRTRHSRIYPSLHLSYDLTTHHQLQLNYSHRVRRPEGDDLNPFPEYQDPFNLRAGNPHLQPEDIHSMETGWQYKKDDTTYLATAYYRQRYKGITEVARYIDATTLLTTKENIGTSRSGGVELGATTRIRDRLALNLSANAYRNEIDASNLGFSSRRATFAWEAKLSTSWDVTKATLVQLNTNYTAKRLTPQGYRYPTHVVNVGLRHNFSTRKIAAVLSVSDVFGTLRERTHIDTPSLRQDITRRRSSRIVYVGLNYTFGKPGKKPKDDLQFDTAL